MIIEDTETDDTGMRRSPISFMLYQNQPNPFNPSTQITYEVAEKSYVSISIYDISGKLVRTLVDKHHSPGKYSIPWDGKNVLGQQVSSGIYLYRLTTDDKVIIRRMLLLKWVGCKTTILKGNSQLIPLFLLTPTHAKSQGWILIFPTTSNSHTIAPASERCNKKYPKKRWRLLAGPLLF